MKGDETFEHDVRASLRASAAGGAPDELVARIGEIPAREPVVHAGAGRVRRLGRVGFNLAAAAVVVIAVSAFIVSRNGGNLPVGTLPGGSAGVAAPSASAAPFGASACGSIASPNLASPDAAASISADGPVVVTLGIYSGRPDPQWTLTVDEAASLDALLGTLPDSTATPPVGGLGYHGFSIYRSGRTFIAYGGAVAPLDGSRAVLADPTRSVEHCLLELSRTHVTPDEYATARVAISAPVASSQPSAQPSASATPGASTPGVAFSPVSVTFVSVDDGWALGPGTCPSGPCAAIARTLDGGRTWGLVPAPGAPIGPGMDPATGSVSGLRFADTRDGWAFGPGLWTTHDGGATWARSRIPGLPADAVIMALASSNGTVHVAVLDGTDVRVASSPVGTDEFRLSPVRVPVGAGPVPAVQLVLSGPAGWLVENDRTVIGGARLVGGAWVAWQPPCTDVTGPAFLAASSPTELAAACDVGLWGNPGGDHLFLSRDGGSSFVEAATEVPVTMAARITSPSPSVIVVGGSDATGAILVGTYDGGRTWSVVAPLGAVSIADLGFTTTSQGVVVTAPADGPASLLMTRDGGQTWRPVPMTGG